MSEAPTSSVGNESSTAADVDSSPPHEVPPTPVESSSQAAAYAPEAATDIAPEAATPQIAAETDAPESVAASAESQTSSVISGSPTSETTEQMMDPPVDSACLSQLLALDVPEVRARRALLACSASLGSISAPSVELAYEWLLEHGEVELHELIHFFVFPCIGLIKE